MRRPSLSFWFLFSSFLVVALCFSLLPFSGSNPSPIEAADQAREGEIVRTATGPEFVPGELLVKFQGLVTAQAATTVLGIHSLKIEEVYNQLGIYRVSLPAGEKVTELAHKLLSENLVEYAEPNYILRALPTTPNDSDFGDLWGLNNTGQTGGTADADIDAPEAWDITTGSSDIVVAVIDTGVDYNHEDLAANIWHNPGEIASNGIDDDGNGYIDDVFGIDTYNGDTDPMDDYDHGTHCSGTIGAVGDNSIGVAGVNWQVKIMALKFIGSSGYGPTSAAIEALNYVVMMKNDFGINVQVTSNSWGDDGYSQALYDAIARTGEAGILFVAAAGNDSYDNDSSPHYPASYDLDNIIAVAATDHDDNLASFSQYGNLTVDVAAPGVNILSTVPGDSYSLAQGTSMATPHVSGLAALIYAANPDYDYQQVKRTILASVDPLSGFEDYTLAGGRINAYSALTITDSDILVLPLWPDRNTHITYNEATEIKAEVIAGANAVLDAVVVASFSSGESPVTLHDDGILPDTVANDGIYTASWTPQIVSEVDITIDASKAGLNPHTTAVPCTVRFIPEYQIAPIPYDWMDIVSTGTELTLGDEGGAILSLPFNLEFYGLESDEITILSNGTTNFEGISSPSYWFQNYPIPSNNPDSIDKFIAVLWDDLNMQPDIAPPQGSVFWEVQGTTPERKLIVQWEDVAHYYDTGGVSFQLIMHEGSELIIMQYEDVDFGNSFYDYGGSATVGIQFDSQHGTQYSYNESVIVNHTAIAFTYSTSDFSISASPMAYSILPGDSCQYIVQTELINGPTLPVELTISGLPPDTTASFEPPNGNLGMTSTLTIDTAVTTPEGTYLLTIEATTPSSVETEIVSLELTGLPSQGLLRVQTSPAVPTRIFIDGIPRNDWSLDWVKMPTGTYTLSFSDVSGYATPTEVDVTYYPGGGPVTQPLSQPIDILPGTVTEVIVNYTQLGNLRVETSPAVSSIISLDGSPANSWGFWVDLLPGNYYLSVTDVPAFATPTEIEVTYPGDPPITEAIDAPIAVQPGGTTHIVVGFIQLGNLWVETSPAVPATIFLDGNPMNDWSFWASLEVGNYTLSFQAVDGYVTPDQVEVAVTAGVTTHVVGNYDTGEILINP